MRRECLPLNAVEEMGSRKRKRGHRLCQILDNIRVKKRYAFMKITADDSYGNPVPYKYQPL